MKHTYRNTHSIFFLTLLFAGVSFATVVSWYSTLPAGRGNGIRPFTEADSVTKPQTPSNDSAYQLAVQCAEKYLLEKKYELCLIELEKAEKIRPKEPTIKDRIIRIKGLIAERQKRLPEYQKYMSSGDAYFKAGDYLNAKAAYQLAIDICPEEEKARESLKKVMDVIRSQKAQNTLYDVAVASADKLLQAKEYDKARAEYENASRMLPSEKYPKDRINEIIRIQVDQQMKEDGYARAIVNGDRFFSALKYKQALPEYENALKLKPEESYPKEKIIRLTAIIDSLKTIEDAYNTAIASGDRLFTEHTYTDSRKFYAEAATIKPEQVYPKNRIAEIDRILAAAKKLDDEFQHYITLADSFYIEKRYGKARDNYFLASKLKPADPYSKEMLNKTAGYLTAQESVEKERDEKYITLLARADSLFNLLLYSEAQEAYRNVADLKPEETYPPQRIREIDGFLAGLEQQKSLDAKYQGLIVKGDQLLTARSLEEAQGAYTEASGLKPAEAYPKEKLAEISILLAERTKSKALDEQYQRLVVSGDKFIEVKSYAAARGEFVKAQTLKPSESLPSNRIAIIDSLLKSIADQKALDTEYASVIKNADKLFASGSYENSRAAYTDALSLKPGESYPGSRISMIDSLVATLERKKAVDQQFADAMNSGDSLFTGREFEQAKIAFTAALNLKPADQKAKTRLAETENSLREIAEKKAKQDQYATLITEGDTLLARLSYAAARASYQKALAINPSEAYPREKITEIEKILADLARQKALDEQYGNLIANADKLLSEKTYEKARLSYEQALAIQPGQAYPAVKIKEIDDTLKLLADQKAIDDKYAGFIKTADMQFVTGIYTDSRKNYTEASGLKTSEPYPRLQLARIDSIEAGIARQKDLDRQFDEAVEKGESRFSSKAFDQARSHFLAAAAIRPGDEKVKSRIAEIEAALKEIADRKARDEQYELLLKNADGLLSEKAYDQAKAEYQKAADLKPAESYPKSKIAEIEKTLVELEKQKAFEDQYRNLIAEGDSGIISKEYDKAKNAFNQALKMKPADPYPTGRLKEIADHLAAIAAQKVKDDQFARLLQLADAQYTQKQYEQAKLNVQKALEIKPEDTYAKNKLSEIEEILAGLKAQEEAYNASITKADGFFNAKSYEEARTEYENALTMKPLEQYPRKRITEANNLLAELKGKQQTYDNLLVSANNYFEQKDYGRSKDTYQQALALFPSEPVPQQRISRINSIIDSLYRANKGLYDKAVAEGDRFYNSYEFDKAIESYNEATSYLPMENYPREMIDKIRRTISENAIADVLKSTVKITAGNEEKFSFTPVSMASRKNNLVYIKIRNLSGKPFNVLMRYGTGTQANGGVVIRNISEDGKTDERLISVRDQDAWYRNDNDWLSLYPQGGDIEVSFIQVSRTKRD